MKVVTNNIELAEIDVVRDHFLCPWRRLGVRRNEASSSGDPCVTEVLRRHNGREREQYGRGNDQSHTEGVEVGPTGDNKRCHDGRHGCYGPASTPERHVPPGKTRQEPIAPTNLSRNPTSCSIPLPTHRWRPGWSTRREAGAWGRPKLMGCRARSNPVRVNARIRLVAMNNGPATMPQNSRLRFMIENRKSFPQRRPVGASHGTSSLSVVSGHDQEGLASSSLAAWRLR
jgi:hypothetical protein